MTLRRRSEDGRDHWQLKLPVDGDRLELEWEADDSAIPAELAALVTAFVRGRPLQPVAELHTLRRSVKVTSGGRPAAEVVHDTVEVLQGSRVVRSFAEVEIEQLADGAKGLMQRLERQLQQSARAAATVARGFSRRSTSPCTGQVAPKRSAPPIEHLRAYLLQQVESLLRNDPVTRCGEMRGVHAMRVATRRMRSALKEARRLLDPGWVRETRAELAWLGGMLGEVRDPDVFARLCRGRGRAARSRRAARRRRARAVDRGARAAGTGAPGRGIGLAALPRIARPSRRHRSEPPRRPR